MLNYNPLRRFPSAEELPDSDDTPVDNELQDLIPGLLKAVLALVWAERWDWFFGVDMGIFYDEDKPPIVPDGFLSLGVQRFIDENLRLSYVLPLEEVVPIFVLEVVSKQYRGEYSTKKNTYEELGVLYYVVYNPTRRQKEPLEVYFLVNGKYVLQPGSQVWLPEIGLGIGRCRGVYQGVPREWLYWYDELGKRLLTPEELIQQEQQRRLQEQQLRQEAERKAQIFAERLRELGIDPENL